MLRIFLNRNYATVAHVVQMLRDNPDREPVHVFGTHADPDSPMLAACDEAFSEPAEELTDAQYVAWALDFAVDHAVDVMIPRLRVGALGAARAQFAAAGVALMAPPPSATRLFEDKAATYADAARRGVLVPPYRVVSDADGLRSAYAEMLEVDKVVCVKPVIGVGADGFRVLTDTPLELAEFTGPISRYAHVEHLATALDDAHAAGQEVPRLMVLPFLTGPEVSVDLLADAAGVPVCAVERSKVTRQRAIIDDPAARSVAHTLVRSHGLSYLSNTQVRYWQAYDDDEPRPYLLEVNARMSGGLFQTALAGVNLPWAAVRLCLGQEADLPVPRTGITYATVSTVHPVTGRTAGQPLLT